MRPERGAWWVLGGVAALLVLLGGLAFLREPGMALARSVLEERSLRRVEELGVAIHAAAEEFGLEPSLIAGIIYTESRGLPDAVSSAGALGLMQLMPAAVQDACKALKIEEPTREELLTDTALNLRLGARHFAWTFEHEEREVERALCAYNAGRARLRRWTLEHGSYAKWRARQLADGDSTVLAYALKVLEVQRRFEERGTF